MKIFYVRPACELGYGTGDGETYENAWNGFRAVDWDALARAEPATVWVCGRADRPSSFMTVHIEWSYLAGHGDHKDHDIEPGEARTHPRRESPQPV